jgi:S1-C subfamily serine protease
MMKFKHYLWINLFLLMTANTFAFSNDELNDLKPHEKNTISIFEKIAPMVVNVHKINHVVNPNLEFVPVETGSGSGFMWDNEHVVTNNHVVQGANEVVVTFKNGKTVRAKLLGTYPRKDIAVLTLENTKIMANMHLPSHFPVADSSKLKVGQDVIAIGNPFGLDHTLTRGIISALNRQIPNGHGMYLSDLIQTDASINPGNSGGPLLNSQGQLIGMNTAIYSTSGSSAGIGFAVLSNDIQRVVNELIEHGKVKQSGIGVLIYNDTVAEQLNVHGVLINKVLPNTPADKAGLRGTVRDAQGNILLGDIITEIDSQHVKTTADLIRYIDAIPVGHAMTLGFLRQGKKHHITLHTMEISD